MDFADKPRAAGTPPAKGMLPGMAAIALFLLITAMTGAFGAARGMYGGGKYIILPVCTLIIVGVFGLLKLRKWGWALVIGGCLSLCVWNVYLSHLIHNPALLVMAGLDLCMFLYLARTEVRERLRR